MSSSDEDLPTSAGGPSARGADTMLDEDLRSTGTSSQSSGGAPDIDGQPRALVESLAYPERYELKKELGAGGMGVVNLCMDVQVGREVAVKVMLERAAKRATSRNRFVREARIQAQLEHPGVVPVYDLGVTPGGLPYFAMKRVRGVTLQQIIVGLQKDEYGYRERFPLRKLLGVVERVYECVAYAHARGVVHRDLKPANVMLGDFGEVNVLDWGIAKLRSDSDLTEPESHETINYTVPGSIIGTAGYMAPEQAGGEDVDARADVYTLGAMLFEVITETRLHTGSAADRMRSTLKGIDARPSSRIDGDVAPELDAICVRALAKEREDRYADAGEMLEELREYLDGQRTAELRREVAGMHAEAARLSLAAGSTETVKVRALRELGAAAVLDPGNPEMIRMIEQLLQPPADGKVPQEVADELEDARRGAASLAAGRSAVAYASAMLALPLLMWMGVLDWWLFGLFGGMVAVSSVGAFIMWRFDLATGWVARGAVLWAFGTIAILSTLFGPFFLVPALAASTAVAFTVSVHADWKMRGLINASAILAVMVPVALQLTGVVPSTVGFPEGAMQLSPRMVAYPELPTTVLLLFSALFIVIVPSTLVGRAVEALRVAQKHRVLQSHRLRSMLPR